MSNLNARLKAIERHAFAQTEVLRGSYEVHCPGGFGHVQGELCDEHDACVFRSTPTHGDVRRQIIMAWEEGPEVRSPWADQLEDGEGC